MRDGGGGGFAFTLKLSSGVKRPSIGAALTHMPSSDAEKRTLRLEADSEAERQAWLVALRGHGSRHMAADARAGD